MAILLTLLLQGDGEVGRLIQALNSDAVEERERAERELSRMGEAVLPTLLRAFERAESEARLRLRRTIDEIERVVRERAIDVANRAAALHLVTIDVRGRRLDKALAGLAAACPFEYELAPFDASRMASVKAKDEPLSECLDRLLEPLDLHWVLEDQKVRVRAGRDPRAIARVKGARFGFRVREFKGGTVLETTLTPDLEGVVEFDLVRVTGDALIERCGRCSPRLVRVRSVGAFKPVVAVTRTWLSRHPVEFVDPQPGQSCRVGDFTIEVDWPRLRIASASDVPEEVLDRVCGDFTFDLKPGVEGVDAFGGSLKSRSTLVERGDSKTWCDCANGPKPGAAVKRVARERTSISAKAPLYTIADVQRIRLDFFKPIRECEEVIGPDLKAGR